MAGSDIRSYEVTFCSRVAGWANALFARHPEWPFRRAEIEESTAPNRKRSDLRIYGEGGNLFLAGEVKLPGTREGRSPHSPSLVEDAATKADNAAAEFFFTWNVNELVLFDRKQWHRPILERRVQDFLLGLELESPTDLAGAEVEARLQEWLGEFFVEFAAIVAGQKPEWGMRLDEWFIRAFESHVSWAVKLTAEFLLRQSAGDKAFRSQLQDWMVNEQSWIVSSDEWDNLVERAARTLCYVFANRLIFYESVRAKFPEIEPLQMPAHQTAADELYDHFQKTFQQAVEATGDYETLFYPYAKDWSGPLVFRHADAAEAWHSVLGNLEPFNFKLIPTDILGGIFRRLIEPEERHKFGQHYTNEDLVDVVNAFCLRGAEDNILDPACGSGSFLVRAYHRKAWLEEDRRRTHHGVTHQDRLAQIYGVDISLFAAHLATLNLAARDLRDEENYPRIRRGNFFEVAADVARKRSFCLLPQGLRGEREPGPIQLPPLQAIIGNPPYVRQELIPKRGQNGVKAMQAKEDLLEFCAQAWPGLKLSGRSDLHCYFWPAAARFLAQGGWFGFLVSSSWLDVEYGFPLQEWVLQNFRIHAILESNAEPWFVDARVKTCAVLLQRCSDPHARQAQLVRFVRLNAPLRTILGHRPDENGRQTAAERFRDAILHCTKNVKCDGWRVVVKKQKALWEEGLQAGRLFELQRQRALAQGLKPQESDESGEEVEHGVYDENGNGFLHDGGSVCGSRYGGGKWGKYLRAPDFYFRVRERYGERFVPLGEITVVRRGITSGCDAFFMPREVSAKWLQKYSSLRWLEVPIMTYCPRAQVVTGQVKLVEAGDGTVHPVETKYLAPEVHSLMNVNRPVISAAELDRLILLVSEPLAALQGTYVREYLRYGEKTTFASKKSKAVPVPQRSTCTGRSPWYDLTGAQPGAFFWPMAQQYRHIVPANPEHLVCNHNLFDVHPCHLSLPQVAVLQAVVNSTLTALFKTFYGRYAGTEGNLKTEVVDVNLLEIPDPRRASAGVSRKLQAAFAKLCARDTGPLVEEEFLDCHDPQRAKAMAQKPIGLPVELRQPDRRALDLAVFELLGVKSAREREALCDELYRETAAHFRQIRLVEIQKQRQRAAAENHQFRTEDFAADIWDALSAEEQRPLPEWLAQQVIGGRSFTLPEGRASLPDPGDFLDANTVFFRPPGAEKSQATSLVLPSRSHAETVFTLSRLGLHGTVSLPESESAARELKESLQARLTGWSERINHLVRSRTSDERKTADAAGLLHHWMVHGRPQRKPGTAKPRIDVEYIDD